MKNVKTYLLLLFLAGCGDLEVDISPSDPLVVVEGWLIDVDTIQRVRLTHSQLFSDSETINTIKDATIKVRTGNTFYDFTYVVDGWYHSNEKFKAKTRSFYQIQIALNSGDTIVSDPEFIRLAPTIDSLNFDFYERESPDNPNVIDVIYYPIATIKDDSTQENFYRWKVYRNDTLFNNPEDLVLISDRFFNGNTTTFANEFTQFEFYYDDKITLELLQITELGYKYLRNIKSQTTTLGTESSVTPAPVYGNLSYLNSDQTVLGYWGITSFNRRSLKISE